MKKYTLFSVALCGAMFFTGCKSSESAYKQAYLKAKQQEEVQQRTDQRNDPTYNNVVTPMQTVNPNQSQVVDNSDNISVRQEAVSVVSGGGLNTYSVVVGSFSLRANADGLQQTLRNEGYDAQVVINNSVSPAMYRVVATTFNNKADAAASRNALQGKFPGAWLLYAK